MSCHDIGRGVDAIMAKVLEMYDDGKISQEAALEMVAVFPRAVHWCDGNEYEAQDTLTNTHCAACLHKYKDGEKFVCYDEVDIRSEDFVNGKRNTWDWWESIMEKNGYNGRSVCQVCFKKYFFEAITEDGMKHVLDSIG